MKRISWVVASVLAAAAVPAQAQVADGRLAVEPYVAYGFFGQLEGGPNLEADIALGARAAFQISDRLALFGNYQRATPEAGGDREVAVSHWSTGVEFSFVPRGGAEGMMPILLEAGLGQARYDSEFGFGPASDMAVNLGIASALQLQPNLAIRFGANDYISNYGDELTNQIFVRVGAEFRF